MNSVYLAWPMRVSDTVSDRSEVGVAESHDSGPKILGKWVHFETASSISLVSDKSMLLDICASRRVGRIACYFLEESAAVG